VTASQQVGLGWVTFAGTSISLLHMLFHLDSWITTLPSSRVLFRFVVGNYTAKNIHLDFTSVRACPDIAIKPFVRNII
jgi:hypothetical protein